MKERIDSIDALRGFAMFWLIGGEVIFITLAGATGLPLFQNMANQMEHVSWDGFHFIDGIFPLFLFIAGVSFPFSSKKKYLVLLKRTLILVLLGLVCGNVLQLQWTTQRLPSVLGRIGIAWFLAAVIYQNTKTQYSRVAWSVGILLSYGMLTLLLHAPDYSGYSPLSPEGNIGCYLDRMILHGHLLNELEDPEGILGTFSAIVTALSGMISGCLLKGDKTKKKKVMLLCCTGTILILTGIALNPLIPINKHLWSVSFVCLTTGISNVMLGVFYCIIDVWNIRKWSYFLKVIGMNSIAAYVIRSVVNIDYTYQFLFGGVLRLLPDAWIGFGDAIAYLSVIWLFLFFLYRKKIFIKI